MKSTQPRRILFLLISVMLLVQWVPLPFAGASELAQRANIFQFPKPSAMGNLVLGSLSGQKVTLDDYRGKVVLLRFTSIQCPACKMEEPSLQQLKQKFGPAGLEIVSVNLVDPPQAIAQHVEANRFPYPILHAGSGGFSFQPVQLGERRTMFLVNPAKEAVLEVPGFPTTYVIDCRGHAVAFSVGAGQWTDALAEAFIQGLITDRKTCVTSRSGAPTAGGVARR